MTKQPQVNIKTLPEKCTVDDLYNYLYNRKERRSHTPAKREEIKRKLLENYLNNAKKRMAEVQKGGADGEENQNKDDNI